MPPVPMRIVLTGGAGLVARHLARLVPNHVDLHVTWRSSPPPSGTIAHRIDLTDNAAVESLWAELRPDVVIHTAYSMTDRSDVVDASKVVALNTAAVGASLVHLSSDMVFGGGSAPYSELSVPDPITDYGRWKLEAETEALRLVPDAAVTRTSLVASAEPLDHQSAWLAQSLEAGEPVTLFDDEYRSPIRGEDLAAELWVLAGAAPSQSGEVLSRAARSGLWHLPGPERLSRWELGNRVVQFLGLPSEGLSRAAAAEIAPTRPRDLELMSLRRQQLGVPPQPVMHSGADSGPLGW